MSFLSFFLGRSFNYYDKKRDLGQTTPEDVERFNNIRYGADRKYQMLDVYRPKKERGKKLPVIVSVHGGAWVYGTKDVYQYYCMSLAQHGFAVVNFSYRLAPRHKYPAAVEDINSVFRWTLQHADKYGLDTNNLFAVGDSAGAHLLSVYACILTNESYRATYDFSPEQGLTLRAIALNCGKYVVDQHFEEDKNLEKLLRDVMPHGGTHEERYHVTPVHFVTENFPPTYLMTSRGDFLKVQAPFMKERFDECGVPYVYKVYGDEKNPLPHVFHCNMRSKAARVCNGRECEFFRQHMVPGKKNK